MLSAENIFFHLKYSFCLHWTLTPGAVTPLPLPATAVSSLARCIFRCTANDVDWETGRTGSSIVTVVYDVVSITGCVVYEFFG